MALPLLGGLQFGFRVLPLIPPSLVRLARLLCEDELLDGYLHAEESLIFYRNPLRHVLTCQALSRLCPAVALIYGKLGMGYAAYLGFLRAGRVLFCHPRGFAPPASRALEVLASTGNQARNYLQFGEKLGVPIAASHVCLTHGLRERLIRATRPLIARSPYAVVAPFTSDPRRAAPLRFFRECIEIIGTRGALPVVVTGLPRHRSRTSDFLSGLSGAMVKDIVGITDVEQLLGILAGAQFLLTNDGGSLHLARLVGTPAIVAFGPTAPEQRLLDPSQGMTPLRLGLSCSPCSDGVLRYRCPGEHLQCLRGLEASEARCALLAACQSTAGRTPWPIRG